MSNTAAAAVNTGPTRTSMEVGGDSIIIVEQNGVYQQFDVLPTPGSRVVHLISPIYTNGEVEHEAQTIKFRCQIMPDLKPGMELKNFVKLLPETLSANILQMAQFRVPQLFDLIAFKNKHEDELSYEYNGMPYKLIYTYTI